MKFDIKGVKDFETSLDLDNKNKKWKRFLETRRTTKNNGRPAQLRQATEDFFYDCIANLLQSNRLEVARKPNERPDIRVSYSGDGEISVVCEGTKIIPGEENTLDGYVPHLDFRTTNQGGFFVKSHLSREGRWELTVLEDFLQQVYLDSSNEVEGARDGVRRPKIEFRGEKIYVASMEHIPRVLNSMKTIYRTIGENRFAEMAGILKGSRDLRRSERPLKEFYQSRRKDLIPARLKL